ncbi:hypothetical protein [Geomicrobium sp. JCM 19037]|nr:hypothetical protein [Geomicrobium sp. JCM 19037]
MMKELKTIVDQYFDIESDGEGQKWFYGVAVTALFFILFTTALLIAL